MAPTDVNRWQRLAPMALLFLIINGGIKFVRENLFLFAGAGAGFAFVEQLGLREFVLGGAGLLLIAVLVALIHYRRFRFRIEGDAMRVRSGLIEKKDKRVRFARVQNVALSQPIYFRPFGLVRFSLETPGAESTEVELPGISRELALALRDRIALAGSEAVEVSDAAESAPPADSEPAPALAEASRVALHAPGVLRVFGHGLVSNQVWLIAGVAAWLFGSLEERVEGWIESTGISVIWQQLLDAGVAGVLALLVMLVVGLFTLSGLLSLIRFHGFQLHEHADRFVAGAGLLDRREKTLRRCKLTGISLHQTAAGRLLGLAYIVGRQATSSQNEIDPRGRNFLIPGLGKTDIGLTDRLMPGLSLPQTFRPISSRFRAVWWSRTSAVVLAVTGVAWWHQPSMRLYLAGGLIVLLVVLWLIHRRWRCWGWRCDDGVCWIRQGLFGLRHDGFELAMVQQAAVVSTPYQRRHGLASIKLVLPHGHLELPFVDAQAAADLVNRAIHAAETASIHRV